MYLAIEGVIGVGKTSLARLLQTTFNADIVLEEFEENPFLSDFYTDRDRYALQTELFFLLARYHQQRIVPELLAKRAVIADYTFAKSGLFAGLTLRGDELTLYRHLHAALAEKVARPDLLIYLRAPTDELMRRIAQRDRPYERTMDPAYIAALGQAYDEFFAQVTDTPILIIEAAPLDFVANPDDLQVVAEQIQQALGMSYQAPLLME